MTVRAFNSKISVLPFHQQRPQAERCLCAQEVERLSGIRQGDAIVCRHGALWVTQAGDPEDYMLRKGERFVASREGVVLVQAINEAACRFYME
jgi:hypothetical protein